jgi:hypothetical protein
MDGPPFNIDIFAMTGANSISCSQCDPLANTNTCHSERRNLLRGYRGLLRHEQSPSLQLAHFGMAGRGRRFLASFTLWSRMIKLRLGSIRAETLLRVTDVSIRPKNA